MNTSFFRDGESGQIFEIDDFPKFFLIWSAFGTREFVSKEPYQLFEFYRKLKYRNISMFIYSQKFHAS